MRLMVDQDIVGFDAYIDTFNADIIVHKIPSREITRDALMQADAVIIRSVTPVDKDLLDGTSVRFVASATAGIDHIDQIYCQQMGIQYAWAPGCNAAAVVDYVLSALWHVTGFRGNLWTSKKVGIIGYGQVGKRLYGKLKALGIPCQVYDPLVAVPIEENSDLKTILSESDVITLHSELTKTGVSPSYHLINELTLTYMKSDAILMNTARGALIDHQALMQHLALYPDFQVVLDVWEHEPDINLDLLSRVTLGTGHIAGHSFTGKLRGTHQVYLALCQYLDQKPCIQWPLIDAHPISTHHLHFTEHLDQLMCLAYDIVSDSRAFKAALFQSQSIADSFHRYRANYGKRAEFSEISLSLLTKTNQPIVDLNTLESLGFQCRVLS